MCVNIFILNLIPDFILLRHAHSEIKNYGCDFDCLLLVVLGAFLCENGIKKLFVIHWIGRVCEGMNASGMKRFGDIYIFYAELENAK